MSFICTYQKIMLETFRFPELTRQYRASYEKFQLLSCFSRKFVTSVNSLGKLQKP